MNIATFPVGSYHCPTIKSKNAELSSVARIPVHNRSWLCCKVFILFHREAGEKPLRYLYRSIAHAYCPLIHLRGGILANRLRPDIRGCAAILTLRIR
ncbi:hypothetical protein EVAR_29195_1 [Eumeta japonica]|uniref:Uncharacterized protein n=1 Tax=Eumeta variegata TaxID=151549 RepID=A0A4C1VDN7_EUMVA|nr:hypothetical protein EVAR_29195_1 [Eumeta japonica]